MFTKWMKIQNFLRSIHFVEIEISKFKNSLSKFWTISFQISWTIIFERFLFNWFFKSFDFRAWQLRTQVSRRRWSSSVYTSISVASCSRNTTKWTSARWTFWTSWSPVALQSSSRAFWLIRTKWSVRGFVRNLKHLADSSRHFTRSTKRAIVQCIEDCRFR